MNNFLTHLELQGFKSFANKTDFELDNRIVGVVGPNGSGKSNIIDAIRWVLGEREAKNLRGDLLENLIFAGTPKRSPASLARVTLRFNNHNDLLPVDAEEVSISRRIDRSGSSQFFVNNKEVRLKDLISIFAKARLGSRSLSIIGQGDADVFVRVNPKERREMIEEILGLKEYRLKKQSAERRLYKSRNNMENLEGKLEEIKPHLRFLRRQKNKWEKRSDIEDKLNKLSEKYFGYNWHRLTEYINGIEGEIKNKKHKKNKKESQIIELEKKLEDMRKPEKEEKNEVKKIRKELESLRSKRLNFEKKRAQLEAKIEYEKKSQMRNDDEDQEYSSSFLLSKIKSFIDEADKVLQTNDLNKLKEVLSNWINNFSKFFDNKEDNQKIEDPEPESETVEKLNDVIKEIKEIDRKIKEREKKEENILSEQDEKNQEFRDQVELMEEKKNEKRAIENKINEKEMAKERAEFRLKELKNKWHNLGFQIEGLENIKKPEIEGDEDWNDMEQKIDRLRSKLSAIGEIERSTIEEAEETEERYQSMTEELEDLKKATDDLEQLIDNLEEKIHKNFKDSFSLINKEFNNYFRLMFGGGKAKLKLSYPEKKDDEEEQLTDEERELQAGVEVSLNLPKKKIKSLDMLSGGEKTLVSVAALFALVAVSPPPFLVLDEIDAALDDENSRRFAELIKDLSDKTQFIIVTHNKVTMEIIDTLYGITMGDDGVSEVLSLKLEEAEEIAGD